MAKGNRSYRRVPKKKNLDPEYIRTRAVLNEVNRKLERLSKKGYAGTWSSKKLMDRLQGGRMDAIKVSRKGGKTRLDINRRINKTEMMAIQKASRQFLVSKTSTPEGIKQTRESVIESLRASLGDEEKELTYDEAEFFYNMLGDNDFDDFVAKVGASTMWNHIDDAIEAGDTEEKFLKRLERYSLSLEDVDLREKAKRIYEKYVI